MKIFLKKNLGGRTEIFKCKKASKIFDGHKSFGAKIVSWEILWKVEKQRQIVFPIEVESGKTNFGFWMMEVRDLEKSCYLL